MASKYRPVLLEGMLKLFYTSRDALQRCLRGLAAKWPIGNPRKVGDFGGCDVDAGVARTDPGSAETLPSARPAAAGAGDGRADSTDRERSEGHAGRLLLAGAGDSGELAVPVGVCVGALEAHCDAAGELTGDS